MHAWYYICAWWYNFLFMEDARAAWPCTRSIANGWYWDLRERYKDWKTTLRYIYGKVKYARSLLSIGYDSWNAASIDTASIKLWTKILTWFRGGFFHCLTWIKDDSSRLLAACHCLSPRRVNCLFVVEDDAIIERGKGVVLIPIMQFTEKHASSLNTSQFFQFIPSWKTGHLRVAAASLSTKLVLFPVHFSHEGHQVLSFE